MEVNKEAAYPQYTGQPPPGQGYPPPGQAYPPPAQQYAPGQAYSSPGQPYGNDGVVVNTQPASTVWVAGRRLCPYCKTGVLKEQFTCCGILLAIFCFPFGLLCCMLMRQTSCSHCEVGF